jgi:RNA polymerase sigma-70 factor (ECF subfamily)
LHTVIKLKPTSSRRDRFALLLQPHFGALYKAARRMTLSPHDAEDLVQDTCIKAFKRVEEFESIEYPRAWLMKVMYHQFIDDRRRSGRKPVDIATTGAESQDPDHIVASDGGPDDLVDRMQKIERVLQAMRCLHADNCVLVAMHDIEGFNIDELCKLTGLAEGTIKARLHRTRVKLGRLLSNDAMAQPHLKVVGGRDELRSRCNAWRGSTGGIEES